MNHMEQEMLDDLSNVFVLHAAAISKRDAEMRALRDTLTREREGHRDALIERDATIATLTETAARYTRGVANAAARGSVSPALTHTAAMAKRDATIARWQGVADSAVIEAQRFARQLNERDATIRNLTSLNAVLTVRAHEAERQLARERTRHPSITIGTTVAPGLITPDLTDHKHPPLTHPDLIASALNSDTGDMHAERASNGLLRAALLAERLHEAATLHEDQAAARGAAARQVVPPEWMTIPAMCCDDHGDECGYCFNCPDFPWGLTTRAAMDARLVGEEDA